MMIAAEGRPGRVFVISLEDGDLVPSCLEDFAEKNGIKVALLSAVGGLNRGTIVAGPEGESLEQVKPRFIDIDAGPREFLSIGIIVPGSKGKPVAHMHGALGRADEARVGCLRPGVRTWLMGEVILQEIVGLEAKRVVSSRNNLEYLVPEGLT